jgi:hypothetical protein
MACKALPLLRLRQCLQTQTDDKRCNFLLRARKQFECSQAQSARIDWTPSSPGAKVARLAPTSAAAEHPRRHRPPRHSERSFAAITHWRTVRRPLAGRRSLPRARSSPQHVVSVSERLPTRQRFAFPLPTVDELREFRCGFKVQIMPFSRAYEIAVCVPNESMM